MTAIYKRELSSYFNSMIGYVFVAVLIFFTGLYFMAYNLYNGLPQFSYTLYSLTSILLFAIPLLTMKSMAEERHSRTDQLLLTSPVTLTGMVLGKYFAMVTIFLIPVALMAFCPLIIAMNGEARLLSDYASLFAFFLMGCVFLAIGMFLSSLTESQIIAAVSTFAVLLILYLWDSLTGFLPSALGTCCLPSPSRRPSITLCSTAYLTWADWCSTCLWRGCLCSLPSRECRSAAGLNGRWNT